MAWQAILNGPSPGAALSCSVKVQHNIYQAIIPSPSPVEGLSDKTTTHYKAITYFDRLKIATSFRPRLFACLNPSENMMTSAMSSLSGLAIATGRNSCFRLSGSLDLPPYPFPAGFMVMNIPELASTSTCKTFKSFTHSDLILFIINTLGLAYNECNDAKIELFNKMTT